MSFEIERRFLVRSTDWRQFAARHADIRQAYLSINNKSSVRVRVCDAKIATLTVKSRPAKIRRLEVQYSISILEAEALIALRQGSVVEKTRYQVPCGDLNWEVDAFSGDNHGLVIAEIELRHERQRIELPAWIAQEISGHLQYYNGFLAQFPFSSWGQEVPPTIRTSLAQRACELH